MLSASRNSLILSSTRPTLKVDLFDHVTIQPALALAPKLRGRVQSSVRHRVREYRRRMVVPCAFVYEFNRFVGIPFGKRCHVRLWFDQFLVAVQVGDSIIACWRAEKIVESLACWKQVNEEALLRVLGEVPFTKAGRCVALSFENLGDRDFVAVEDGMDLFGVASFCDAHGIATGHQRRSRRAAYRLSVEAGELHAFHCHGV